LAQEVTEWVLHPRESNHAECGGVYISANPITPSAEEFIPSAQKSKSEGNRILHKNRIKFESRGKATIVTSLIYGMT